MKDYRLSEIKAICEEYDTCDGCPFYRYGEFIRCATNALQDDPCNWQIDEEEQDDDGE